MIYKSITCINEKVTAESVKSRLSSFCNIAHLKLEALYVREVYMITQVKRKSDESKILVFHIFQSCFYVVCS